MDALHLTVLTSEPLYHSWDPDHAVIAGTAAYLGVVAREQALSHGPHIRSQQLEPLVLVAHLLHVDVHGGHILVASGQP